MKILLHTWTLVKKEAQLELKNMYGIASVILYVVAIIVVLYLSLASQGANKNIEVKYWNVLFWIMLLFASINTDFVNPLFKKPAVNIYTIIR